MSFYWLLLVIFGAILTYNFVLLNKKTVCKADRNTQGFDYAKLLNRHKKVLIWSGVIILVTAWIVWLNLPDKNKPTVASAPAKAAVQAASSSTQAVIRDLPPQTKTVRRVSSPTAKTTVQDDPPPRPDWLHVGTEKKGWSLRIAAPSTWTKTRPNNQRIK